MADRCELHPAGAGVADRIVLIRFVYKRRVAGLVLAAMGTAVVVGIYRWLVP